MPKRSRVMRLGKTLHRSVAVAAPRLCAMATSNDGINATLCGERVGFCRLVVTCLEANRQYGPPYNPLDLAPSFEVHDTAIGDTSDWVVIHKSTGRQASRFRTKTQPLETHWAVVHTSNAKVKGIGRPQQTCVLVANVSTSGPAFIKRR